MGCKAGQSRYNFIKPNAALLFQFVNAGFSIPLKAALCLHTWCNCTAGGGAMKQIRAERGRPAAALVPMPKPGVCKLLNNTECAWLPFSS